MNDFQFQQRQAKVARRKKLLEERHSQSQQTYSHANTSTNCNTNTNSYNEDDEYDAADGGNDGGNDYGILKETVEEEEEEASSEEESVDLLLQEENETTSNDASPNIYKRETKLNSYKTTTANTTSSTSTTNNSTLNIGGMDIDNSNSSSNNNLILTHSEKIKELRKKQSAEEGLKLIRQKWGSDIIGDTSPIPKQVLATTTSNTTNKTTTTTITGNGRSHTSSNSTSTMMSAVNVSTLSGNDVRPFKSEQTHSFNHSPPIPTDTTTTKSSSSLSSPSPLWKNDFALFKKEETTTDTNRITTDSFPPTHPTHPTHTSTTTVTNEYLPASELAFSQTKNLTNSPEESNTNTTTATTATTANNSNNNDNDNNNNTTNPQFKPLFAKYDESSSEDEEVDLMMHFRQIQARQQKESQQQNGAEGIAGAATTLEEQKKVQSFSSSTTTNNKTKNVTWDVSMDQSQDDNDSSNNNSSSNDDDDEEEEEEEEGHGKSRWKKQRRRKRRRTNSNGSSASDTSNSKSSNTKRQRESSSEEEGTNIHSTIQEKVKRRMEMENLWSDSSQDDEEIFPTSTTATTTTTSSSSSTNNNKKKNGKNGKNSKSRKDGKAKATTKKKGHKKKKKRVRKDSSGSDQNDDDPATSSSSSSSSSSDNEDDEGNPQQWETILKPEFEEPKFLPSACEPLVLHEEEGYAIPASMNRYIQEYQREGISFLFHLVMKGKGAILGDDMGLGKTVQAISLISALHKKTGTKKDWKELKDRRKLIENERKIQRRQKDEALLTGNVSSSQSFCKKHPSPFAPTLVIVPASLITQWKTEFDTWGYHGVSVFQGDSRNKELEKLQSGINDVMIVGVSLFRQSKNHFEDIPWKLVIFDEFHSCKNTKSAIYQEMKTVMDSCRCPLIGMTGTPMSNDLMDMWTLVDLVQPRLLGEKTYFKTHFATPIKNARTKDAKPVMIDLGEKRNRELTKALKRVYLKRNKSDVLKDELKQKDERVILCKLTDVQKQIYQHILTLPDYEVLIHAENPCNCEENAWFFQEMKMLTSKAEKLEYRRRNKGRYQARKKCCWQCPFDPNQPESASIDPRAALWIAQHSDGMECPKCPNCTQLPCMHKLHKISAHASLLQLDRDLNQYHEGQEEKRNAEKTLEFAKVALTPDVLYQLPGNSYVRRDTIMNDHTALSGKIRMMESLLMTYQLKGDRVLIFSYSTKTLDLIQHFIKSKGYSHLRLDGTTPVQQRQPMVDEFNNNPNMFIFLISTKAGGVGLNLTGANRVIIFDVNWNPSLDNQAQDRAYRIGQKRDVEVVRLVSRGTIEEQMYIRQLYKIHLSTQTLDSGKDEYIQQPRLFKGIMGDKDRKGELFGIENLFKFKDGNFMDDIWKSTNGDFKRSDFMNDLKNGRCNENVIYGTETASHDDEGDDVRGMRHEDFLREDKGEAALQPGDRGYDEEMGGQSQALFNNLELSGDDDDFPASRRSSEQVRPSTDDMMHEEDPLPNKNNSSDVDDPMVTENDSKQLPIPSDREEDFEESKAEAPVHHFLSPTRNRPNGRHGVFEKPKGNYTLDSLFSPSYIKRER